MAKFPPAGNGVNGWGRGVGGCSVFTQNILAVQNVNYKLPLRLGIFKLNCYDLGAGQEWCFFRDIDQSLQEPRQKANHTKNPPS